ncbi:hypothetical protein KCU85_g2195, partial [Aureobasidium melanogenum]
MNPSIRKALCEPMPRALYHSASSLRSWTDVAEVLLTHGFQGNRGQIQRMARTLRSACLEHRNITLSPQPASLPGPLLQALRDISQPLAPAPAPLIQAVINARDFQPLAAQQDAEELGSTADGSRQRAQQSQDAKEPRSTDEESHHNTQNFPRQSPQQPEDLQSSV